MNLRKETETFACVEMLLWGEAQVSLVIFLLWYYFHRPCRIRSTPLTPLSREILIFLIYGFRAAGHSLLHIGFRLTTLHNMKSAWKIESFWWQWNRCYLSMHVAEVLMLQRDFTVIRYAR